MTFNPDPHNRLAGVRPALAGAVMDAGQTCPVKFIVVQGLRSREEMMINYGKGRTAAECEAKGVPGKYADPKAAKVTWLANPFASKHGTGDAVDVGVLKANGYIDWSDPGSYAIVAKHIADAATKRGIKTRCLAPKDPGHTEIVR